MAFTLVHLLSLLVGALFLANGYYLVSRDREALALFAVSVLVGAGLIFVAVFPNVFEVVASVLGLEWKARAMLVVANLTLFVVISYLVNRIGTLYDRVSRLNEEVSLLKNELEEADD